MKPLILEMQAFGPFAGQQVIDFRELGSKTFFLIHGPTGSGKTTILDGICYALFGDSSGGEREGKQMRSHHAEAECLTEVSFDFLLGMEHYRVRRVPEQMRPAKRGGGETKQTQQAELWRVSQINGKEQASPMETGWIDVTRRITELLGFEIRQFRQVIMLPQGKFRDFLMSNSQDRERILQTLFGTELYKRIEEALKGAAAELQKQAEQARTQREALLNQVGVATEAALQAKEEEQLSALAACRAEETVAQGAAAQAEAALAQGRLVEAQFVERDQAQAALVSLQGEQPDWQKRRIQLAAARKAALIRPHEAALEAVEAELARVAAELAGLDQAVEAATRDKDSADAALAQALALNPEIDQAVARLAELESLSAKVAALAGSRSEHGVARKALEAADKALENAQQNLAVRQVELKTFQEQHQQAQVQAATRAGHQAAFDRITSLLEQRKSLETRKAEHTQALAALTGAESLHASAEQAADLAHRQRDDGYQAWVASQAARLAHTLTEGQPCPVCGSASHPTPAHADEAAVPKDALKRADAASAQADAALRQAEQALAAARTQESLAGDRVAGGTAALAGAAAVPVAELQSQQAAAKAELDAATKASEWITRSEAILAKTQSDLAAAEAAQQAAEAAANAARERVQALAVQLAERGAGIPPDLADPKPLAAAKQEKERFLAGLRKDLADATAAARAAATQFTTVTTRRAATVEQNTRLADQCKTAAAALEQRVAAAGFVGSAEYRSALLTEEAIADLDEKTQAFEAALQAASQRAERAVSTVDGSMRPDLPAHTVANEAAKAAYLAAGKAVQAASSTLENTRKFIGTLLALQVAYAALEARYGVLKQVADVASGNNSQRMSFQRYVLATLLEEVLAATTLRLKVMSRGRYEMHRKIEPTNLRAAAGLDLEIFDQYTGTSRSVSTLSGGESFLASLALALGLSDVVQSYAGGIRLDAIFVDEGFGTLDPEALDFAIRALKDLQQAGRLVGIISHVAELKEWIDARLELTSTHKGSTVVIVG